jgi:diacylglycerol kinase family enzyme
VKGRSRFTLAKIWATIAIGRNPDGPELETIRTPEFTLETEPRQYVSIDGEPITQTPLQVAVARQALNILVPRKRNDIR